MKIQLVVILLVTGVIAAEEVSPSDLAKGIDKKVGQEFTFTDDILQKTQRQEIKGYVKFETVHIRCIISDQNKEDIQLLDTLLGERAPRRATITGKVTQQKDLQVFFEVTSVARPRYKRRGS